MRLNFGKCWWDFREPEKLLKLDRKKNLHLQEGQYTRVLG